MCHRQGTAQRGSFFCFGCLNEQVKRNKSRFPQDFMFQLSSDEDGYLKSQNATSSWGG
ncbi:MAG: ORF6N domain-containing protein, partial [Bacteroidales bacterium]|nr:ORF6N domain-containing protein [Bacteroidales bacterium]